MIPIVYVPPPTSHISREDQINMASIAYSTDSVQQTAFRAGAHWADGPDCGFLDVVFFLVIGFSLILQIVSFLLGLMEGTSSYSYPITNRWKYVFPLHNLAFKFSRWMKTGDNK